MFSFFKQNSVNSVIRTLVISDFFLFFAIGLLTPIFAVFVLENVDNRIEVVGLAVSCYWLTRVLMVMPFSLLMDKLKGEVDEFLFMVIGTFALSAIPLFYIIATEPWHVYFLQIANGLASAMAVPAWRIIFTNHIDRRMVGFEWSLEDIGIGIATAASAAAGAFIAARFGWPALFATIFLFGLISALILLSVYRAKKSVIRGLLRKKTGQPPLKIDALK